VQALVKRGVVDLCCGVALLPEARLLTKA